MLPAGSAGHPGNVILLFFNCAASSSPTLIKQASLFNRAGTAGLSRHLPVKEGTTPGHMTGNRWRFDKEAIDGVGSAKSLS